MYQTKFEATALWLRRIGNKIQMLAEIDGKWRLAAEEHFDGPFSHIAEGNGADFWPIDNVVHNSLDVCLRRQTRKDCEPTAGNACKDTEPRP